MGHIYFDIIIAIGILITAIPAVFLLYKRKQKKSVFSKHSTLSLSGALLLLLGTVTLIYGSFIESRLIVLNPVTIDLPNITEPITIVFVADSQVGPYKKAAHVERLVDRILALQPDLVFYGGDFIDNFKNSPDETVYLSPFAKLASEVPTYGIHGNHEYGIWGGESLTDPSLRYTDRSEQTKKILEELGVRYLVNEIETITVRGESFDLFGGDSIWAGKLNYEPLDARTERASTTIALIHNPVAAFSAAKHGIDLMLAGHTHGGQIRLPFIGPVGRVDDIIPAAWYQGLHNHEDMKLLVTSGVGESGARARLFNPPEIVLLTIE